MLNHMKEILPKGFGSGGYCDHLATRVWGDSPRDEP